MELTIWGSRGSVPVTGPNFVRHGGATTCLSVRLPAAVDTPEHVILDFGSGAVAFGRRHPAVGRLLALQTHLHWDHIQGFPFFTPIFVPGNRIEFHAVERDGRGLEEVLRGQMKVPTFPVTLDVAPADLVFNTAHAGAAYRFGELEVRSAEMTHPSGSTAWRLEHRGASVVFSGDCEVELGGWDALVSLARDADVLVMDAQYFPDEYLTRKGWGHSTMLQAVAVAQEAGVRRLILTHHDPSHDDARLDAKLAQARAAAGRLLVDNAYDGMLVDLFGPVLREAV